VLHSSREYTFLQACYTHHEPNRQTDSVSPLPTHLGNVVENATCSTLTASVCAARNSATSRSAGQPGEYQYQYEDRDGSIDPRTHSLSRAA
jgi:hypothetical protein